MEEMLAFAQERVLVNAHSSVRVVCEGAAASAQASAAASGASVGATTVVYVDPYLIDAAHGVPAAPHDADVVCFTHSHYDHFSPADAAAVARTDGETRYVMPASMVADALAAGIPHAAITTLEPNATTELCDISIHAVPAYNAPAPFHPRANNWVGYVIAATPNIAVYVCGDTDANAENAAVTCDILCVPVGGKYTMDTAAAAELVAAMHENNKAGKPSVAIPTHYGSVTGTPTDGATFARAIAQGSCQDVAVIVPY